MISFAYPKHCPAIVYSTWFIAHNILNPKHVNKFWLQMHTERPLAQVMAYFISSFKEIAISGVIHAPVFSLLNRIAFFRYYWKCRRNARPVRRNNFNHAFVVLDFRNLYHIICSKANLKHTTCLQTFVT